MGVFDQPSVAGSTCRRRASSVALQSLTMLNDSLALEGAEHFAKRVHRMAGDALEDQVDTAFRLALARRPEAEEIEWSLELLRSQAKVYANAQSDVSSPDSVAEGAVSQGSVQHALMHLCRVLFNSSEFLYIE